MVADKFGLIRDQSAKSAVFPFLLSCEAGFEKDGFAQRREQRSAANSAAGLLVGNGNAVQDNSPGLPSEATLGKCGRSPTPPGLWQGRLARCAWRIL